VKRPWHGPSSAPPSPHASGARYHRRTARVAQRAEALIRPEPGPRRGRGALSSVTACRLVLHTPGGNGGPLAVAATATAACRSSGIGLQVVRGALDSDSECGGRRDEGRGGSASGRPAATGRQAGRPGLAWESAEPDTLSTPGPGRPQARQRQRCRGAACRLGRDGVHYRWQSRIPSLGEAAVTPERL
jgi:hypothetical protein